MAPEQFGPVDGEIHPGQALTIQTIQADPFVQSVVPTNPAFTGAILCTPSLLTFRLGVLERIAAKASVFCCGFTGINKIDLASAVSTHTWSTGMMNTKSVLVRLGLLPTSTSTYTGM